MNHSSIYYAHSGNNADHCDWQTLKSHAHNVGEMAGRFASIFKATELAYCMGILHDLGKYSPEFNERLHGGQRVDHATAGAKIAVERWGLMGKIMAYGIAGHHAGLANGTGVGQGRHTLADRLALQFGADIPKLDDIWQTELNLPQSSPKPPPLNFNSNYTLFPQAFFARMLYSCLVDADFLDTEAFYATLDGKTIERGQYPTLPELHDKFNEFIANFRQKINQKTLKTDEEKRQAELNILRNEVLDFAVLQANNDTGLFTLTVPTGGGKTFTSMAFALEHAKIHDLRRVIYVIPFTSIIEQNANEFRKAFGELGESAVLEHHSVFDDSKLPSKDSKDKLRLASENWDMPVVVTTAVQFFESLFADRSSRCRKLHNIAGSVIILDEAQMLPLKLLRPIMASIDELARNYRCSVVMCTATQPAVQASHGFYKGFDKVRELAPNPKALFEKLKRTMVSHIGVQTDADLQDKLTKHEQILIIVNNRRHAKNLYNQNKNLEGMFHLSTLMCAKHRTQILTQIRERLKDSKPCRVVATSLIEAGVDVDFACVMRAEAGLDSVAQAAGRCNREGKRSIGDSQVWIFKPDEQYKTPPELGLLSGCMTAVVREFADDLLSTEAVQSYFEMVYKLKGKELDSQDILGLISSAGREFNFKFQDIANKFKMIESHMIPVIVPFGENKQDRHAETLINALWYADKVGGIARKLQPYTVQVPKSVVEKLYNAGRIELINGEKFGTQFYALIGLDLYDEMAGLDWDDMEFIRAENLIIA